MTSRMNALGQPIGEPLDGWQAPPRPTAAVIDGTWARLERLEPDRHARALYEANALDTDGRNWTYLPVGPFAAFDDYERWLRAVSAGPDPYFFAVIDRATGRPVGVASYLRLDPASGVIEVGHIAYSPLLQRTPAATEAMYLLMKQVFDLGYRRYEWKCDSLNAPSRAAAQRLGFSFEGIFRQAVIYKGRNRDTAWYAITDKAWPALQAAFAQWLAPANFDDQGQQQVALTVLTRPLLYRQG